MDKNEIRKTLKAKRKALTTEEVKIASTMISASVAKMTCFAEADLILSYLPIQNEVDTSYLHGQAKVLGVPVAVPRVDGDSMDFYLLTEKTELKESNFHVQEPTGEMPVDLSAYKNVVMLVPGVGFDKSGHRIGYGKGFYDRYLAGHSGITTIGLAYEFQVVEELPFEKHDISLKYIIH